MAVILDAMLESTVKRISKLYIIYKKQTFIAIKTNFTHKNLKDIFMYEKKTHRYNLSSLSAILDATLYQCSLIN